MSVQVGYPAESLGQEFDRWGEQHVSGPGLYFLVVSDVNFGECPDWMRRTHLSALDASTREAVLWGSH